VAINDLGEVVGAKGYYPPDRQSEAYILARPGGGPVIIAPDGVPSALNAVNNTGEAVGWADKLILFYRNGKVLRRSGPAGSARPAPNRAAAAYQPDAGAWRLVLRL